MKFTDSYVCVMLAVFRQSGIGETWLRKDEELKYKNIMLVKKGRAVFKRNGEEIIAYPGDLIYYDIGDIRSYEKYIDEEIEVYGVNFDCALPDKTGQITALCKKLKLPFVIHLNESDGLDVLYSRFDELCIYMADRTAEHFFMAANIVRDTLSLVSKVLNGSHDKYYDIIRIDKVKAYIGENYTKRLKVKDMADIVGVSASYFAGIFREQMDKSPIEYLNEVKLEAAARLIDRGMSVSEAAMTVGYKETGYFSKMFKRYYGVIPKTYKRPGSEMIDLSDIYLICDWADDSIYFQNGKIEDICRFDNISFVYSGSAMAEIDGKEVELKRGDVLYFKRGSKRKIWENGEICAYGINFHHCFVRKINESWIFEPIKLPFSHIEHIPDEKVIEEIKPLMDLMLEKIRCDTAQSQHEGNELVRRILNKLIEGKYSSPNVGRIRSEERMDKIKEYIGEYYLQNITVKEIAEKFLISAFYLEKLFKREMRMTVFEYIISLKIEKAKELLKRGESVSAVCGQIGYADATYFCKMFKKHVGETPGEYMKKCERENKI